MSVKMSTPKSTVTPEQIQIRARERLKRRSEQARLRRLKETPEQKRHRLDKALAYKRKRRTEETPEQKRHRLDKGLAYKRKRQTEETPEEKRQRLDKNAEQKRIRMDVQRMKMEPQQILEELEKKRFYALVRGITMTEEQKEQKRKRMYFWYQANKERFNSEEVKKRRTENYKMWVKSLTGEKKERYLESVRKALRKSQKKIYEAIKRDPGKWEEHKRKQKNRHASETPEETLRRKRKDKVNTAKRKLRRKLNEENVSREEIELQLRDLGERMWKDFYPEGNVPISGSIKRGCSKKLEVDSLSAKVPFVKEHCLVTFEQGPNSPHKIVQSQKQEYSRTLRNACKQVKVEHVPEVDLAKDVFMTCERLMPASAITENAVILSPPSSPGWNMQESCETTDPVVSTSNLRLPCPHCDVTFSTDQQLRSHIFTGHSKTCWKCPKCKQVMLSPQELSQHYASAHKNIPKENSTKDFCTVENYLCLKCPSLKWFERSNDLFTHVKQQHSSNFWPCLDCHVLKYSEHAIRVHHTVCHTTRGEGATTHNLQT